KLTLDPFHGGRGPLGDGDPGANPRQAELEVRRSAEIRQFDILISPQVALDLKVGVGPVEERVAEIGRQAAHTLLRVGWVMGCSRKLESRHPAPAVEPEPYRPGPRVPRPDQV